MDSQPKTDNPAMTAPTPGRRGRKHFDPGKARLRSMDTILGGWETLEALNRYRALLPYHLAQLLFLGRPDSRGKTRNQASAQQAANRECLRWLKDRQYVTVIDAALRQKDRQRLVIKEMLILTPAGHQALSRHRVALGLAPLPAYSPPGPALFDNTFKHWLSLTTMAVSAEMAVRRQGGQVDLFWDDYAIRQRAKTRHEPLKWGGLEPDGLMIATINGQKHALLFEADQDTESIQSAAPNSLRSKVQKYGILFASLRQRDPLLMDLRQPTVHFAFNSIERLGNAKAEIERQGGGHIYWLTLHEWLQPPYDFLGEVWQVAGAAGYFPAIRLFVPERQP